MNEFSRGHNAVMIVTHFACVHHVISNSQSEFVYIGVCLCVYIPYFRYIRLLLLIYSDFIYF